MASASQLGAARSALSDGEEVAFLRALVTFAKGNGGAPALYRTDAKHVLPPPRPGAGVEAPTQTLLRAMWRVFASQGRNTPNSSQSQGGASRKSRDAAVGGAEGAWLGKPLHRFPVTATLRPALVRLLSSAVESAWKQDQAQLGPSFAEQAAELARSLDPVAQSLVVTAMDLAPGHVPKSHLLHLAREAVLDGDHKTAALLTKSHGLGPEPVPAEWVSSVWTSVFSAKAGAKSPIARGVTQSAPPPSTTTAATLGHVVIDLSLLGNDYQQAVGVAEQAPNLGRHLVNVLAGGGQDKLARRAMKRCGLERDPALSHVQDQKDATTLQWMVRSGLDEELVGNFLAHVGMAIRMATKQAGNGELVAAYRVALACKQALEQPAGAGSGRSAGSEPRSPGRRTEAAVRSLLRDLQTRGADTEMERVERAQRPPRWVGDSPDPVVCVAGRWVPAEGTGGDAPGGAGGEGPVLAAWDPSRHLLSHLLIAGDGGGGGEAGEVAGDGSALTLPRGTSVYAVEDEEGMAYAADALARAGVFGFDSEWAPGVAGDEPLACDLLQFGTSTEVFLVDTHRLFRAPPPPGSGTGAAAERPPTHASEATARAVAERLLGVFDPSFGATPLAFAPAEDFRTIRNLHPALASLSPPAHMVDLAQWREQARRFKAGQLLTRPPAADPAPASLAQMVERVLGRRLDKGPRLSNWARRPLRPSQAAYAALDAAVLVQLYSRLKQL